MKRRLSSSLGCLNQNSTSCLFLNIAPYDFATQLTLLDLPVFKSIRREELTSVAWNGPYKYSVAPNVVAFAKRFNMVTFWVVQEILSSGNTWSQTNINEHDGAKFRAKIITHFIKISKHLKQLNNLHSCHAIVSALRSSPIYRLQHTWSHVGKKYRLMLFRFNTLFSDENNYQNLRRYTNSLLGSRCIPYLAMYLRDLVHINEAHHFTSNSSSPSKTPNGIDLKKNPTLDTISIFQSSYYDLNVIPSIQEYLNSVNYIEELQRFLEEDNYKLSLKLEPPTSKSHSHSKPYHKGLFSFLAAKCTNAIGLSRKLDSEGALLKGF